MNVFARNLLLWSEMDNGLTPNHHRETTTWPVPLSVSLFREHQAMVLVLLLNSKKDKNEIKYLIYQKVSCLWH